MENSLNFPIRCFGHFILLHKIIFEDKSGEQNEQAGHLPWGWWTEGASGVDRRVACLPEMPKYVSCGQSNWFLKPETTYIWVKYFVWEKIFYMS